MLIKAPQKTKRTTTKKERRREREYSVSDTLHSRTRLGYQKKKKRAFGEKERDASKTHLFVVSWTPPTFRTPTRNTAPSTTTIKRVGSRTMMHTTTTKRRRKNPSSFSSIVPRPIDGRCRPTIFKRTLLHNKGFERKKKKMRSKTTTPKKRRKLARREKNEATSRSP